MVGGPRPSPPFHGWCVTISRVRIGRGWWWAVLFLPAVLIAASPRSPLHAVPVTPELSASLQPDYTIDLMVRPHRGDAWSRLSKRITGDAEHWSALAAFNHAGAALTSEQIVRVPWPLLRPELQREVMHALFPLDTVDSLGWHHVVTGSRGGEGESLWVLAEWFTGKGENYGAIRKANPAQSLSTRKGEVVLIPREILSAPFAAIAPRGAPDRVAAASSPDVIQQSAHEVTREPTTPGTEGANASKTTEVRKPQDDPDEQETADATGTPAVSEAVSLGQPSLSYERDAPEPYAVYRLQRGEALYSSVAIRFTGRVYSKDVGDVLDRIVKFNGISDVARMRVGYHVKIPMSLLLPEYLPVDDPQRLAREQARRDSAKLARRARARGLQDVRIILDAGHGGRDAGTTHDGMWESSYVYDVMCRLKRVLEKRSAATVFATTKSKQSGYSIVERDVLREHTDHVVLTSPKFELGDSVVGVNLRWYLANSIYRRALKNGVPEEKVVFLSIHADSLHPSLRGAMAYIPGERYVRGSFTKRDRVYLARAEVRESPVVHHSEEESLAAEGLSRDLAESIIDSFTNNALKVHPFNPVRDNVVRNGREWVPAIIRYNLVPTRVLLEICNLGNANDRKLMKTAKYRQELAEAIYEGLVAFYSDREEPAPVVARAGE